jgi:hypothetical protein
MEAIDHDQPHKHQSFAKHCRKAFVLGTSTKHYWCWKFWLVTRRATRISDAAFFKHKYLTNPTVTPEDRVIAAAGALARAPSTRQSNAPPHAQIHHPGPQKPPRCVPTSRHQLQCGSRHSCHPSGTSKGAPRCTSQTGIPRQTSNGGHYQAISLTISPPLYRNSQ